MVTKRLIELADDIHELLKQRDHPDKVYSLAIKTQHNQLLEEQIGELTKIRRALEKTNEPKGIELPPYTAEQINEMLGDSQVETLRTIKDIDNKVDEFLKIDVNRVKEELFEQVKGMFFEIYKELSLTYSVLECTEPLNNKRMSIITKYQEKLLTILNLPRD